MRPPELHSADNPDLGQLTMIEVGPRGDLWTTLVGGQVLRYVYSVDLYGNGSGEEADLPRDKYFLLNEV